MLSILNKYKWVLIGLLLSGGIGYGIYYFGFKKGKAIDLPDSGSGIPQGWSAREVVESLKSAKGGWTSGDDEQLIFVTLQNLTNDQLAAVYNEFEHSGNGNLFEFFRDFLSTDEYNRAISYFKDLKI